ncbi:hypothetical protein P389DRAFT_94978 [Cystobasidium minutum MCA 4210]|uniref:uncharacterized protein n=1 Tax=Cystobasidium minutum MCA 4210 TaxID=1397322 RepID=UPI0034CFB193|eukprot:jgi/Rhomi1/94978/CE94977_855
MQPNPKNQLSWSTAGSVEKNLPVLTGAHSKVINTHKPASVLELASGFGDHVLAYAREHPTVTFRATECDEYLVSKLSEKINEASLPNVLQPTKLDVLNKQDWARLSETNRQPFDMITVTNLVNVAPWAVTEALFETIGTSPGQVLERSKGVLCLYAALKKGGAFQSEADAKFDATLRARTPEFGLRDFDDIVAMAEAQGLKLISEEALGGGTNLFLQFQFVSTS